MGHEEKDWAGLGSWRGVSLGPVKSKRRAALKLGGWVSQVCPSGIVEPGEIGWE